MNQEEIESAKARLLEYYTRTDTHTLRDVQRGILTKQAFWKAAGAMIANTLKIRDAGDAAQVIKAFDREVFGYATICKRKTLICRLN